MAKSGSPDIILVTKQFTNAIMAIHCMDRVKESACTVDIGQTRSQSAKRVSKIS